MQTTNSPNPLHHFCLDKLEKILDLAMKTAETASAEGNHKIVLQAAREVTRIITLMTKLEANANRAKADKTQAALVPAKSSAPAAQNVDLEAMTDSVLKEMFKLFPALDNNHTFDDPVLQSKNRLFWNRDKGGKSVGNTIVKDDNIMKY